MHFLWLREAPDKFLHKTETSKLQLREDKAIREIV